MAGVPGSGLEIVRVPVLSDNYSWLVHDADSGETIVVDPGEAQPVLDAAAARGWTIDAIWTTHWHPDHVGGNAGLVAASGATVIGPEAEREKIGALDRGVAEGDTVSIGAHEARVLHVPGHTSGHIAFHLAEDGVAFVGDSVFALGCGRMFEGTPDQFWASLERIKALPPETMLYCAHEYTQSNAKFALHADPENAELQNYVAEIDERRARSEPTVPTKLERELATNPFLRADNDDLRGRWGGSAPHETFAALRAAKDNF